MMCYKDKTWCSFYTTCTHREVCDRKLTPEVILKAMDWWEGENPPISVFMEKPGCYENK